MGRIRDPEFGLSENMGRIRDPEFGIRKKLIPDPDKKKHQLPDLQHCCNGLKQALFYGRLLSV